MARRRIQTFNLGVRHSKIGRLEDTNQSYLDLAELKGNGGVSFGRFRSTAWPVVSKAISEHGSHQGYGVIGFLWDCMYEYACIDFWRLGVNLGYECSTNGRHVQTLHHIF